MKRYILAGAAALALALPAAAQDTVVTSEGDVYVLTDAQQVIYDAWPPERRVIYDAWPITYREYYWTLTPTQMDGWWVLTDDQRVRVYAMTPEQRTAAWTAIAAQLATPTSAPATAAAPTAVTTRFVSNEVAQSVPTDTAPSGDPPICAPDQQDNCINAWEAGKRGAGVTRPLDYWPGKPASEIPGDKPITPGG